MKSSILVLTALFAAALAAVPARAKDKDKEGERKERIEVRVERDDGERGDRGGPGGGDWERGGGREGGPGGPGGGDGGGQRGRQGGPGGGVGPGWMKGGPSPELRAKFDKMRELEEKLRDISRKIIEGKDAGNAAAKAEARKVVGELFDTKVSLDEMMIGLAEKNLAEMKAKLAKRKEHRERAIESRVARVTGEGDDWD